MVPKQCGCGSMYRFHKLTLVALALLLGAGAGLEAQDKQTRFFRDIMVGGGLHYQSWSQEGEPDISEFSIPLVFIWPLSKRLTVDLVTGSGFASLDTTGSNSLGGLTDTKVRASIILGDEVGLLTAGVSTPTGKTGLSVEEQEVSNSLAQGAFNFRTPNFGQGLDLNVGLAMARKVGETVFGLGAGYLLKGEFTPRDQGPDYKPGSELSLTFGLDRKMMDGGGKVTLDAIYTLYSDDEQDGKKVFRSGNKLLVQGLFRAKMMGLDWGVYLMERLRGKSERFQDGRIDEVSNGNQLEVGGSVTKNLSPGLALRGLVDLKIYADNVSELGGIKFEQGEATLLSAGPGIRLKLGPGRFLDLNARYGSGKIDTRKATGMDVSGGIWIRL